MIFLTNPPPQLRSQFVTPVLVSGDPKPSVQKDQTPILEKVRYYIGQWAKEKPTCTGKISETYADLFGAEIMGDYFATKHMIFSPEEVISAMGHWAFLECSNFRLAGNYASAKERINIILANDSVAKAFQCEGKYSSPCQKESAFCGRKTNGP